jgi:hypothetical protein
MCSYNVQLESSFKQRVLWLARLLSKPVVKLFSSYYWNTSLTQREGKGTQHTRLSVYLPFTYKSRSVSSKTLLNDMLACESFIRA